MIMNNLSQQQSKQIKSLKNDFVELVATYFEFSYHCSEEDINFVSVILVVAIAHSKVWEDFLLLSFEAHFAVPEYDKIIVIGYSSLVFVQRMIDFTRG
mgnify:FL=1